MNKSYEELVLIEDYKERFEYLKLDNKVCDETFGVNRYLNQIFYRSKEWKNIRNKIIKRDLGHDMAMYDDMYEILGPIYIHHINPIVMDDILNKKYKLIDPNNLVCVSFDTHQALHYSDFTKIHKVYIERKPNDTTLW